MSILESINSPAGLRTLNNAELKQLSQELRETIVDTVAKTGGHLASSLGAVELTVALHKVFNTPEDKLVWDVGHQTYAHKLITGRQAQFHTLRQYQGLAGFPKREESIYDTFNTGHSSTSLSAALGMARARDMAGLHHKVVAVIGDGSLSNGLALEALNDAGHKKTDLLVVLNDNSMSISPAVGGLSHYLNHIISGRIYNRLKPQMDRLLGAIPAVGKPALKLANYAEEMAKGLIVPGLLFEELGLRYFGPVNGHDLDQLTEMFGRLRELSGPLLLHVKTIKGKGFELAENNPVAFHGTPRFDIETGESKSCQGVTFSKVFGRTLVALAKDRPEVAAIVAAMTSGTAMDDFARLYPERFFDVGIAEGHAVTLAAGMATQGVKPVVVIYSTFLQRAFDMIMHDVCLQNLPVVFAIDRAGVVGEDGPTHHGVFDIGLFRPLPRMALVAPGNDREMAGLLKTCLTYNGPIAIRYPRGVANGCVQEPVTEGMEAIPLGKAKVLRKGYDVLLIGVGPLAYTAMTAARRLKSKGIEAAVINPLSLKPLDTAAICAWAAKTKKVITIEDHVLTGGFGSSVLELFSEQRLQGVRVVRLGYPDQFVEQGPRDLLLKNYHLDAEGIAAAAVKLCAAPAPVKGTKKNVELPR